MTHGNGHDQEDGHQHDFDQRQDHPRPAHMDEGLAQLREALDHSDVHRHRNVVIIFDDEQDAHHEHFREVCLRLKDHDLGLEFSRCVFDAENTLQAGIELDDLNGSAVCMSRLLNPTKLEIVH